MGAILLDNHVCNQAIELLRREDFFLDSHRRIFEKMIAIIERAMPIDVITLGDELRRAGEFERVGGATYIASLIDGVPRTDTIEPYAKLVKQKANLRTIISTSRDMAYRALDGEQPEEIVSGALMVLGGIREDLSSGANNLVDAVGCTGEELEAECVVDDTPWIALGYFALGVLTEVIGRVKEGKTRLLMALVKACLFGGDFLGHYVSPCSILYLSEQGKASFQPQAREAGILGSSNLTVIFHHEVARLSWEEKIALAVKKAEKIGASGIVVDTFGTWAAFRDDDENNNSEASSKMRLLADAAARKNLAIITARHARKSGGDPNDAGRGASGITGAVDICLLLRKSSTNQGQFIREIEAISRFHQTPLSVVIELAGTHYRLLGDTNNIRRDRNEESLLKVLSRDPDTPMTIEKIQNLTGMARETARRTLRDLVDSGHVRVAGEGRSKHPFVYWVTAQSTQSRDGQTLGEKGQQSTDIRGSSLFPPKSSGRPGGNNGQKEILSPHSIGNTSGQTGNAHPSFSDNGETSEVPVYPDPLSIGGETEPQKRPKSTLGSREERRWMT